MSGYSQIYYVGAAGGFRGSDGLNDVWLEIRQKDGNRQSFHAHFRRKGLKPMGGVEVVVPAGPDHPDGLLDACLAFAPQLFEACPSAAAVSAALADATLMDFDLGKEQIPAEWAKLRDEARPIFAQLPLYAGTPQPLTDQKVLPNALIGMASDLAKYHDSASAFLAKHGKWMYPWTHRVTVPGWLPKDRPFLLYLYQGEPIQQVTHFCVIDAWESREDAFSSPYPAFTEVHEQAIDYYDGKPIKTWFRVTHLGLLPRPLRLGDFDNSRGPTLVASAMRNAFAYVRAQTGHLTPASEPAQEQSPLGIFVRLGPTRTAEGETIDARQCMDIYLADQQVRGHTWFSTDGLAHGMAQDRIAYFRSAIERGEQIPVYFIVGIRGGGNNRVEYEANLADLESSPNALPCPRGEPPERFDNAGRIWLKLVNLRPSLLDPAQFTVESTGNNLADAVMHSQVQFGYVRRNPKPQSAGTSSLTETDVLDRLHSYLTESGFLFDHDTILKYWISLKTKPFVILSGLSGSGKSKLPSLVADALGARFLPVAVSPAWIEDSDLLGYISPLDQTNTFQSTMFMNFLLQAAADRDDQLWFVCLDEMNLAKVEHYFAKFLSAMEGLHARDRNISLHSGSEAKVPRELAIPESFFFTGTVNMDETTHTFSPKVLDRANVIEFDVTPDQLLANLPPRGQPDKSFFLSGTDFRRFQAQSGDTRHRRKLAVIARILAPVRAHFGFRVREEIERYIANGQRLADPNHLLDWQIHQKILPKVKGSGLALSNALASLAELAQVNNWTVTLAKVQEMTVRLHDDGITHFYK